MLYNATGIICAIKHDLGKRECYYVRLYNATGLILGTWDQFVGIDVIQVQMAYLSNLEKI